MRPSCNTYTTTRLAIPHPIGGAGFGIINGHFYVAGGRDGMTTNYNGLWDYDIAANTWTQRANLIGAGINVPGSGVANGQLWLFGGGNPFDSKTPETTNASLFYTPVYRYLDGWTKLDRHSFLCRRHRRREHPCRCWWDIMGRLL